MRLPRALARRLHRAAIGTLERLGWVVARSSDYYSPLRPVSELRRHVARWHRPSGLAGLSFDLDAMTATLESLVAAYGHEYSLLPSYEEIKRRRRGPGFTTVDAMVLYMMLRRQQPRRYVEVGSGLSTYYAHLAAARNAAGGRPARITVVDPFASAATRELPEVEVVAREAQDLPAGWYGGLEAGDVLFIDSTHIVRVDGEVPYLVLEVLPILAPGVVVHFHDVHFPFNVPCDPDGYVFNRRWPLLFTEAMLVQAYLCHNPRLEILLSTPLLRHHREEALRRLVPGYRPLDAENFDTHHGSLWLRCLPGPAAAP
jgi:predicted O-methyltransferase YrrM